MLVAVSILAILAAVVLPSMSDDRMLRVRAASNILISDIEHAQTLNISFPNDPVVMRFGDDGDRYWLAYADSPDDPLSRSDTGEPYLVVLGEGRAAPVSDIELAFDDLPDNTLAFNAQGGLEDFLVAPIIVIRSTIESSDTSEVELHIAPTTGRIKEVRKK